MRHIHPDYDQLRAVGKALNSALFKELTQDEYKIAARRLDAIKKGKMHFDSYDQFDKYTDFCINDYVDSDGENIVKRYQRKHHETISTTEARILNALLTAQSSLFQILSNDTDTASKYQHAQNPDLALCWSNIYELISEWLDNNPNAPFIFQDFMELLKSEGMGQPAPISHDSIMYYYASLNLKNKIGELIKLNVHPA